MEFSADSLSQLAKGDQRETKIGINAMGWHGAANQMHDLDAVNGSESY